MFCSYIYLFLLYFCVRRMFCYQIYFSWLYFSVRGCFALIFMSTTKNTKKVTTFLLLCDFCSSTIFKHFSCISSLLDECFLVRFMNTVKNTKKVTTFLLLCDFFVLLPYVTTFLCSIFLLD